MKLFGKRQWILSIFGLISGLVLGGYILKYHDGVINFWIIGLTGLMGLSIIILIGRYANK
jgi:hypothetical protein